MRLLGSLQAEKHKQPVKLPSSRKARAVLGYLAASHSGASRDELCGLLFSDTSDPRGSLRWVISRLRSVLGDNGEQLFLTSGDRIALPDSVVTDVSELQQLVRGSRSPDLDALLAADAGIAGGFLDGLEFDDHPEFEAWRLTERARCLDLHCELLHKILRRLPPGREVANYARRLVNLNTGNESAWANLVEAMIAAGNLRDAHDIYRLAHRELAKNGVPLRGQLRTAISEHHEEPASDYAAQERADRPIMTVLPCDATEDIDSAIARLLTVSLVSAATRNTICGVLNSPTGKQAARTTQRTDYELRSFVSRSGDMLELRVQMVLSVTGAVIFNWQLRLSEREPLDEQAFRYFASHFEFDIVIALMGAARDQAESDRTVSDRFVLALPYIYSAEGTQVEKALEEFNAVSEEDPHLGAALCAAGWVRNTHPQFNSDPNELAHTSKLVRRAVDLCPDDAFVLGWAAVVLTHTDLDVDTATDLVQRALAVNPYSPLALIAAGWTAHFAGEHERSLAFMDTLEALDSAGPVEFLCYTCRAMALYQLERFAEAETWCRRAIGHNSTFIVPQRVLAAVLVNLSRVDEARTVARRMVALDASENLAYFRSRSPYRKPEERERLCLDLAAAGLPES